MRAIFRWKIEVENIGQKSSILRHFHILFRVYISKRNTFCTVTRAQDSATLYRLIFTSDYKALAIRLIVRSVRAQASKGKTIGFDVT